MKCPYCGFVFKQFIANGALPVDIAPILCEDCLQVGLLINGVPERMTASQLDAVKKSPAWREMIEPSMKIIREAKEKKAAEERARAEREAPPVDRTKRTLTDGSPVTPDHREINPATGQQKGYVVLSAEERAKGFVRPVRKAYTHLTCGCDTTMSLSLAETYARDPKFYNGTFCAICREHFPLDQFVWTGTDEQVGS